MNNHNRVLKEQNSLRRQSFYDKTQNNISEADIKNLYYESNCEEKQKNFERTTKVPQKNGNQQRFVNDIFGKSKEPKFDYIKALEQADQNAANFTDQNLNRKSVKSTALYYQNLLNENKNDPRTFETKIADYQRFYSNHFAPSNFKTVISKPN